MYKTDREFNEMIYNSLFMFQRDNEKVISSINEFISIDSNDNNVFGHLQHGHDISNYSIELGEIKDDRVLIDFMNLILQEHVFNKYKLSELFIVDRVN